MNGHVMSHILVLAFSISACNCGGRQEVQFNSHPPARIEVAPSYQLITGAEVRGQLPPKVRAKAVVEDRVWKRQLYPEGVAFFWTEYRNDWPDRVNGGAVLISPSGTGGISYNTDTLSVYEMKKQVLVCDPKNRIRCNGEETHAFVVLSPRNDGRVDHEHFRHSMRISDGRVITMMLATERELLSLAGIAVSIRNTTTKVWCREEVATRGAEGASDCATSTEALFQDGSQIPYMERLARHFVGPNDYLRLDRLVEAHILLNEYENVRFGNSKLHTEAKNAEILRRAEELLVIILGEPVR